MEETFETDKCLDGFICVEGNCRCSRVETYNELCDRRDRYGNFENISAEARVKALHKELGYEDELCFPGI